MTGLPAWPLPGQESFASEFRKEIGGGAAITACGLSKLGLRSGIVGVVGKSDGQWILDRLIAHGVSTDGIRTTGAESTAITVSVSTSADRRFLTYNGANRELPAIIEQLRPTVAAARPRHIHLAYPPNLSRVRDLFEALSSEGSTLSVDVGWHPKWYSDDRAIPALKLADVFFPNELEAGALTRETEPLRMLRAFERKGLRRVALKLGKSGAALLWDGEVLFKKSANTDPVDTTGAGDCFNAGFLYAQLIGLDPKSCLQAATACGAMSARALGGIAGFPSKDELESILCTAR